jgi:hypothetical protein
MSEEPQRRVGYTWGLALAVLIPSAAWGGLIGVHIPPNEEILDLTMYVPFFYWLVTTILASIAVARPPQATIRKNLTRKNKGVRKTKGSELFTARVVNSSDPFNS